MEFLRVLDEEDQVKVTGLLDRAANHWPILNREKFKKVDGAIFEFKSFQVRLLCFQQPPDLVVVTHGVIKKRDDLRPEDIRRAKDIMGEHEFRWDPVRRIYRGKVND